jgi:hypothetical protein
MFKSFKFWTTQNDNCVYLYVRIVILCSPEYKEFILGYIIGYVQIHFHNLLKHRNMVFFKFFKGKNRTTCDHMYQLSTL